MLRPLLRSLARSPWFTAAAIATIAIGIAASTAVFSAVDRVLFRPLPYPAEDRLVSLGIHAPLDASEFMLGADYYEWRREHTAFEEMTTWSMANECDLDADPPERLQCARVESNFIGVLGVKPALGRGFTRDEDRPGGPGAVLLTWKFWNRHPVPVGATLRLDGVSRTVVGVLPREFEMPRLNAVDVLVPQALNDADQQRPKTGAVMRGFARLRPGVSIEQARAALAPYMTRSLGYVPAQFRQEVKLVVRPLRELQTADARAASWTLAGAVLALMLIAAANVANLLIARAVAREREWKIRSALGATRLRLAGERASLSVLLALAGGVAGCGLAWLLVRVTTSAAPDRIVLLASARVDNRVLLFAAAMSLVAGLLAGLVPPRQRLAHAIVAGEIAASLVLLAAAGLLARHLWRIESRALGFHAPGIYTANIVLGRAPYPDAASRLRVFEEVERRVRGLAGVDAMAVSDTIPPTGGSGTMIHSLIEVEGAPRTESGTGGMVAWRSVSEGFFETLDIPILRGRAIEARDRDPHADVVVIGEPLARQLFGAADPLGHRLRLGRGGPWRTIIGVAGPIRNHGADPASDPEYYLPRAHAEEAAQSRRAVVIVRSRMQPKAMSEWIRAEVAAVDRTLPVTIDRMDAIVAKLSATERFQARVLGSLAAVGLVLAALGLYGVMAVVAAQRVKEIGIRMALGASRASVVGMMLRRASRWIVCGLAAGLAGSFAVARVLRTLLAGAPAQDPLAVAAAAALLTAVAIAAVWIPAHRAARADPLASLRHD